MKLLVAMLVVVSSLLSAQAPGGLKVIVIDGDEAANIVAERIAAEPVIEVRDGEDRKVAGAVVRFLIRRTARDRIAALFSNGQSETTALTDETGRAHAATITPLEVGIYEIVVQVSHQGRTATTTIRHTNFATTVEAQNAGRSPSTSGAAAATAGASAVAGAAAAGGGLSKLAIVGIAAGGAAGVGAAVALAGGGESGPAAPAPRVTAVTAVTASAGGAIQSATPFTFSTQVADFGAGSLTYQWEFGDGTSSTEPAPSKVYVSAGRYTVAVTIRGGAQSARSETTVNVYSLAGRWVSSTGRTTVQFTQSGNAIAGVLDTTTLNTNVTYLNCSISGTARAQSPAVLLNRPACLHQTLPSQLVPAEVRLDLSADGQTLVGTSTEPPPFGTLTVSYGRQ